jgi:hypothetical protein
MPQTIKIGSDWTNKKRGEDRVKVKSITEDLGMRAVGYSFYLTDGSVSRRVFYLGEHEFLDRFWRRT